MEFSEYIWETEEGVTLAKWHEVAPHIYEDVEGYCCIFLFEDDITLANVRKFFPNATMEEGVTTWGEGVPPHTHLIFRYGTDESEGCVISGLARTSSYKSLEEVNQFRLPHDWPEKPVSPTWLIKYHLCFPNGEYQVGQVVPTLRIWLGNKHYEGSLAQRILAAAR